MQVFKFLFVSKMWLSKEMCFSQDNGENVLNLRKLHFTIYSLNVSGFGHYRFKKILPLFCDELYGYVGNSLLIIVKNILLVY